MTTVNNVKGGHCGGHLGISVWNPWFPERWHQISARWVIFGNKYMMSNICHIFGDQKCNQLVHWCKYVLGNLGLEDVRVALGWVQQNIGDFGLFSKTLQE